MGAGNFQAALMSVRNSFAGSSKPGMGRGYFRSHKRSSQSPENLDFTADIDLAMDSSAKDRKKVKREKFQPY